LVAVQVSDDIGMRNPHVSLGATQTAVGIRRSIVALNKIL
jgi:hypothetical protein